MRRKRKPHFPLPVSVIQRQSKAQLLALCQNDAQRARVEADFPEDKMRPLPVKRAERQARPLEADVKLAVRDLLAAHPKVSYALRFNSGMAWNAAGVPVHFHAWIRSPEKCRMPDFYGALITGAALALEIKRPGWKSPSDQREHEQAAFLALVRSLGGVAAFITEAEQVAEILA